MIGPVGQARSTKWLTQTDQFKEDLVVVRAGSSSSIWVDEIHHEDEVPRHPSAIAGCPGCPKTPGCYWCYLGRYGGYGSRLETQKLSDFTPTWYPSNCGPQFSTQKTGRKSSICCRPRTEFDRVDLRVRQHKPGGETEPPTNPTSTG